MRKPIVAAMCGLSFSGKSTFARRLAEALGAEIVSFDAINDERGLHGGDGIPVEEWVATKTIGHERVEAAITDGRSVVVDDTGSPRFLRDELRDIADRRGAVFAVVWVRVSPELQRERVLANRSSQTRHDVVDDVLESHRAGFEEPVDEDPVIIDAMDTLDPRRLDRAVSEISLRGDLG